jgi:Ca2+-binding RTX toxin-like protein
MRSDPDALDGSPIFLLGIFSMALSPFTIHSTTGADATISTSSDSSASIAIYDESGGVIASGISVNNYTYVSTTPDSFWGARSGTSLDTLVGGSGNDLVFWDSGTTSNLSPLTSPGTTQRLYDSTDSLDRDFEMIYLAGGNDILNLSYSAAGTAGAYLGAVSAFGGAGADLLVTSSGNDYVQGDGAPGGVATAVGIDTIHAGAGNDVLFGDIGSTDATSTTGSGDLIYAGLGDDTAYGEGGDDLIVGGDATTGGAADGTDTLFGGDGADTIWGDHLGDTLVGGNDLMFGGAGGDSMYGGGGDDVIVGGADKDTVFGGAGGDAIAGYDRSDNLFGGSEGDVLWGGAGKDVVYGGTSSDYLYGGPDTDVMYGGTGEDYYYFGRVDGNDQIYDVARGTTLTSTDAPNYIVVYGTFDYTESGPTADFLLNGSGVFETDNSIMNATGMVRVTHGTGTTWTLSFIDGTTASVTFDSRDIQGIALWNSDFVNSAPVLQYFGWDGSAYSPMPLPT